MTTQLDSSIGLAAETVYGTGVTPTRFVEFTDESLDWAPDFVQGGGLRAGWRTARSGRRALGTQHVEGDLTVEAVTKGLGMLWNAALGNSTVTKIGTGPAYQHLHTPTTTDYLPSYTIQKGVPLLGGGAVQPHTFQGCVCANFELSVGTGEILKLKTSWQGRDVVTATAYTPPVYAAEPVSVFTFAGGTIALGGTVTVPTATALASGGTAIGNIREASVSWDNQIDDDGYTLGAGGKRGRKPAILGGEGKGSLTAEFDSTSLRDAYLNQTDLALVLTFTAGAALQTGIVPTLQVVAPCVRLEGELPKVGGAEVVTQSIDYTILDNLSGSSPLYVAQITGDTAL